MTALFEQLPSEIKRVKEMTNNLQGMQNIIKLYEKQFNEKYIQGSNICYEIARVNILRKLRNEQPIC